jgi:hypothetical protein
MQVNPPGQQNVDLKDPFYEQRPHLVAQQRFIEIIQGNPNIKFDIKQQSVIIEGFPPMKLYQKSSWKEYPVVTQELTPLSQLKGLAIKPLARRDPKGFSIKIDRYGQRFLFIGCTYDNQYFYPFEPFIIDYAPRNDSEIIDDPITTQFNPVIISHTQPDGLYQNEDVFEYWLNGALRLVFDSQFLDILIRPQEEQIPPGTINYYNGGELAYRYVSEREELVESKGKFTYLHGDLHGIQEIDKYRIVVTYDRDSDGEPWHDYTIHRHCMLTMYSGFLEGEYHAQEFDDADESADPQQPYQLKVSVSGSLYSNELFTSRMLLESDLIEGLTKYRSGKFIIERYGHRLAGQPEITQNFFYFHHELHGPQTTIVTNDNVDTTEDYYWVGQEINKQLYDSLIDTFVSLFPDEINNIIFDYLYG